MQQSSRWKTLSSKYVYENPWIKVRHDEVLSPQGKEGVYGIVESNGFSLILPKIGDDFFLIETYRYAIGKLSLEFPAGGIESGESIERAAARELLEETGLSSQKIEKLGSLYSANGFTNDTCHVFLAEDCQQGKQLLQGFEDGMQVKKVSLSQLKQFILSGQITDGPTVSAFCLYLLHSNSV